VRGPSDSRCQRCLRSSVNSALCTNIEVFRHVRVRSIHGPLAIEGSITISLPLRSQCLLRSSGPPCARETVVASPCRSKNYESPVGRYVLGAQRPQQDDLPGPFSPGCNVPRCGSPRNHKALRVTSPLHTVRPRLSLSRPPFACGNVSAESIIV